MSTANFRTMDDFPLYVHEDDEFYLKRCDECDTLNRADEDICWECGADLTGAEREWDEWEAQYFYDSVEERCKELSCDLMFHTIKPLSGHYSGMQLYVELADNVYYLEYNEDCKYYFGMYKSQANRKYEREINKVNKLLKKIADEFNFITLRCVGVFSNGEAVYERIA